MPTEEAWWFVQVIASLRDADDTLVGTDFTFTALDVLRPGDISPFHIFVLEPDEALERYELQLDADAATRAGPPAALEIVSDRGGRSGVFDWFTIVGEVRNTGAVPYDFVQIIATFYDEDGDVVATDFTFAALDTLPPGGTSPFELLFLDDVPVASYRLQVQGTG